MSGLPHSGPVKTFRLRAPETGLHGPKCKARFNRVVSWARDALRMLSHSGNPIPEKTCAEQVCANASASLSPDEFMQLLEAC